MIPMPAGMRIWVACGVTDMRRGFDGLARPRHDGAGRSEEEPLLLAHVRVPRQAGGPHKNSVVGRRGPVPLREAK
jgi:hypothetical protein